MAFFCKLCARLDFNRKASVYLICATDNTAKCVTAQLPIAGQSETLCKLTPQVASGFHRHLQVFALRKVATGQVQQMPRRVFGFFALPPKFFGSAVQTKTQAASL